MLSASFSAWTLESFLMLRFWSRSTRSSTPTWSIVGEPSATVFANPSLCVVVLLAIMMSRRIVAQPGRSARPGQVAREAVQVRVHRRGVAEDETGHEAEDRVVDFAVLGDGEVAR